MAELTPEEMANQIAPDTTVEKQPEPVITDPPKTEPGPIKEPEKAPEGFVSVEKHEQVLAAYRASMGRLSQIDKNFDQFREKLRSNPKMVAAEEITPAPAKVETQPVTEPSIYDEYGQLKPNAAAIIADQATARAEANLLARLQKERDAEYEKTFNAEMDRDFNESLDGLNGYLAALGYRYDPVASRPDGPVDSYRLTPLNGTTPEESKAFMAEFSGVMQEAVQLPFANVPGKSNAIVRLVIKNLEAARTAKSVTTRLTATEQADKDKLAALDKLPKPIGSPAPSGKILFGDELKAAEKKTADQIAPDTIPLVW